MAKERDLLAYLDTQSDNNPTNAQGRDLFEYLGNQEVPTQPVGSSGLSTNLFKYDPSKYDIGGVYAHELGDLESIRERNQGVWDALGRSTANLIGKTGLNVIGGLGGTAYGILDAIGNGEFRRVWDNDFNRAVDSASESVGDYFRVYKSGDYEDMNILQKAFLHPIQFVDEFMDALSFTTGAVVTEMLTSGMASGLVAARALKYFKNIDKASKATAVGENLGNLSQRFLQGMGNGGTLTRQLATGAAWEGSVEARHTAKQMEEDMIREWHADNPNQEMPDEVLEDIIQRTTDAGMFTFLTNIALVGGSNLVQFPRIFGSSYNTARRGASGRISYDRGLGRYVDETAENLTRGQRVARNTVTALRNPFMEGLVEEGGQGVISGTASAYWDRKNDDDSQNNVDRFLNAFGQSFIDTYTTKEGWNEIGMGMLIGSIGAPGRGMLSVLGRDSKLGSEGFNEDGTRRELWTGGITGAFQERNQRDQEIASMVERINQNTDFMKAAKAHYDFLTTSNSLQKDQDIFLDAGDVFNYQNIKDDQLHAYISSRIEAGLNEDLDTLLEQLESTSPEDFYAAFRGEELEGDTAVSDIDKRNFKRDSIKSLKDRISNTREAYKLVDRNYQGSNSDLREALIYSLATAKNLDAREESINQDLTDLSRGYVNNINIRNTSNVPATHAVRILEESLKNEDLTEAEKTNIQNTITRAKALLEQVKGKQITVGEAELLAEFIENRPTEATTNLEDIVTLLDDSRKLRFRREHFIDLYNQLFTAEGQKAFAEHQEAIRVAKEKAAKEAEAAERRRQEFEKQAKENKAAEKRQQDIKKKAEAAKETKEETSSAEDDPFADIQPAQLLDEDGVPIEQPLVEEDETTVEENALENEKADIERRKQEEKKNVKKELVEDTDISEYEKIDLSGYFNKGYDMSEAEKNKRLADDIEVFVENNDSNTEEDYKNYIKTQGHTLFAWAYRNNIEGLKQGVELYKKLKKATEEIDAKYDAKYVDAVKKGEMTKEQALQALEEAGRKDSSAFAEIAALEASAEETSTETGLTSEEKSVLAILDAQEAVATTKEIKNDGAILPYTPSFVERFRQKVRDILDITRKREVANTVISLNIDYVENVLGDTRLRRDAYNIWDQYDESGDLMINENFDSRLQDPKQFKVGDTLTIIFPTFEQIEERGIGELTGDTYTRDRYNQDIVSIENFPIAFTDTDGNIVGFLPTTDNVRRRVAEDNLPLEIQANIDLRTNLFDNQDRNYTVTITDKSTGTPMFSQNSRSIYNALGEGTRLSEGVKIGVFKNGRLRDGLTTTINGNILPEGVRPEEAFEEGRVYIVVPTAKEGQSFTFEADVNRVSPEAANAVVRMIQLFRANPDFRRDADLISERDSLSSEIDFTDFQSFITAVQSILYVDEGANMFQIDTKNAKIRLGITKDKIFDLNEFMTNESVRQSVANELAKRYPAIRLTNFGSRFDTFELNEEGSLAHRDYRNYFDYINEKEIITTNIHGRPIEGTDKLYFTAQSVIEIDDKNIKESPRQIEAAKAIEASGLINTSEIQLDKPRFNPDNAEATSYPIKINSKYAGVISVDKDGYISSSIGMAGVELEKEFQGKGYGTKVYIALAEQLAKEGKTLKSEAFGKNLINESANRVWKSLLDKGYAIDRGSYFEVQLKDKQQDQQPIEEAREVKPVTARANPLGARKPVEGVKTDTENDNDVLFNLDVEQSTANSQTNVQYQLPQGREQEEFVASEKTIRDLAARMSDRIGIPVRFESDRTEEYKGKLENGTAVINLAYATLDTPIHEVLGHPIIRALKQTGKPQDFYSWAATKELDLAGDLPFLSEEDIKSLSKKRQEELQKEYDNYKSNLNSLYQNLLKELEYGKGKEVFDRVKRDYQYKYNVEKTDSEYGNYKIKSSESGARYFDTYEEATAALDKYGNKYTLEEQQEEAVVELLGLMAAEKLDKVKDGKLISLLKRLLKEMKAFMKQLLGQKEVEIDKLPDNMKLGDIADLLAYSNSKLILPGNEVIYTTPDNQQFKTYQEASNHISELSKNVKNINLDDIKMNNIIEINNISDIPEGVNVLAPTRIYSDTTGRLIKKDGIWHLEHFRTGNTELAEDYHVIEAYKKSINYANNIYSFIEKNKEYEQSKEIIEEWKKVNNIQYNPEEVYSRGQEFVSVVGAYSDFDVNLMMQNLLQHIEDNQKAGGEFTISAFTKPVDKQIGHLEGGGGKIKFKIHPQSQDIKWAANTDVYSGSVWDASEKVSKDKKSELLGVSYTKYPALRNVNEVQPNLAAIIDNLAHHHNELGISLTGNNFRLEYDENISYQTKKIIDSINKILDQKYGKLVKPEIKNDGDIKFALKSELNNNVISIHNTEEEARSAWRKLGQDRFTTKITKSKKYSGIQPTQTKETLKESIDSVKTKVLPSNTSFVNGKESSMFVKYNETTGLYEAWDTTIGFLGDTFKTKEEAELFTGTNKINKNKEYTEQALINTKIAKLKEIAKKYPRSLIRSEVRKISILERETGMRYEDTLFGPDELPFQKIPNKTKKRNKLAIQVENLMRICGIG